MKQFLKLLLPPIAFQFLKKIINLRYGWRGSYTSWEEADKKSLGYDDLSIFYRVYNSSLEVQRGNAKFERDGCIFFKEEINFPLVSGLMMASSLSNGMLSVLDFGGSLGSTYHQNINFLKNLNKVSWGVVEQDHFYEIGTKEFQNNNLSFFKSVDSCINAIKPNVLLFSAVLHYLEHPFRVLEDLIAKDFPFIIIDRTPFTDKLEDKITIQHVNPKIYKASYPSWIFSLYKFKSFFERQNYELVNEFNAIDESDRHYFFKGFIFKKIDEN